MDNILEGILEPTGKIKIEKGKLPDHSVRVKVTILDEETTSFHEIGDYLSQLEEYELRLARGEIQWK